MEQQYIWETPEEINREIAARLKSIRKRKRLSQQRLCEISGVTLGTLKRFETTGNISLLSLTKLAIALGVTVEMKELFSDIPYHSMEEVLNERR